MIFICLLSTAIVAEAVLKINQSSLPRAIPGAISLLCNSLVVVVVVALLFYVHGKHLRSCGDGQLT